MPKQPPGVRPSQVVDTGDRVIQPRAVEGLIDLQVRQKMSQTLPHAFPRWRGKDVSRMPVEFMLRDDLRPCC